MTLRVELDTCAVSDALDSLGLLGVVVGLLPLTGPARIAGPVRTVLLGPPGLEAPRSESHLGSAIVVSAAAGEAGYFRPIAAHHRFLFLAIPTFDLLFSG